MHTGAARWPILHRVLVHHKQPRKRQCTAARGCDARYFTSNEQQSETLRRSYRVAVLTVQHVSAGEMREFGTSVSQQCICSECTAVRLESILGAAAVQQREALCSHCCCGVCAGLSDSLLCVVVHCRSLSRGCEAQGLQTTINTATGNTRGYGAVCRSIW